MNLKISYSLTLMLLVTLFASAQIEEIYVDENMNKINKEQFFNNCSKRIFRCSSSTTDSLIVNTLHSRFKFGKISPEVYSRLLAELYKNNNPKTNQTIVLRFVDRSIGSYENYVENETNEAPLREQEYSIFQNGNKKHFKRKLYVMPKSRYIKTLGKFFYRENKCQKKINKKTRSKVFHIVKYNFDSLPKPLKNIDFIKESNYLEDIRTGFPDSTRYVVIQPKGDYFSSERFVHPDDVIDLINKSDWSEFKRDLKYSNSLKYKKGYGFFKSLPYRYRNYYLGYDLTCF